MKVAFASATALVLCQSATGFTQTQQGGSRSSSTELYKYRPTKWTPSGGAAPSWGGASVLEPPAPVSYDYAPPATGAAPIAYDSPAGVSSSSPLEFGGMPKAAAPVKGSYAPTKWSPQGGSSVGFSAPAAGGASAVVGEVVAFGGMPRAVKAAGKDYSGVHWTPSGGANPGAWGVAAIGEVAAAAPEPAAPPAPAGPTMEDLAKQWAAMNSNV